MNLNIYFLNVKTKTILEMFWCQYIDMDGVGVEKYNDLNGFWAILIMRLDSVLIPNQQYSLPRIYWIDYSIHHRRIKSVFRYILKKNRSNNKNVN